MRLIYKVYNDKSSSIYRTDDDGGNPQLVRGEEDRPSNTVRRISVYIEVSCDDRDEAFDRARTALGELPTYLSQTN